MNKVDEQLKQLLVELIKMTDEELDRFVDFMSQEKSITQSTKRILREVIKKEQEHREGVKNK